MMDTCRLCRLGLLSRMPLCLGKHVEWACGTARQCRLSRFITRYEKKDMSLGKWIPVVIAILTVIADEMDE